MLHASRVAHLSAGPSCNAPSALEMHLAASLSGSCKSTARTRPASNLTVARRRPPSSQVTRQPVYRWGIVGGKVRRSPACVVLTLESAGGLVSAQTSASRCAAHEADANMSDANPPMVRNALIARRDKSVVTPMPALCRIPSSKDVEKHLELNSATRMFPVGRRQKSSSPFAIRAVWKRRPRPPAYSLQLTPQSEAPGLFHSANLAAIVMDHLQ